MLILYLFHFHLSIHLFIYFTSYVSAGLRQRAIRTPGAKQKQLSKHVEGPRVTTRQLLLRIIGEEELLLTNYVLFGNFCSYPLFVSNFVGL